MVGKGGKLPEIMLACNKKQEELKKQGLQDKVIANLAVDRCKNKDLDALKSTGSPFTSFQDSVDYLASDTDDHTKLSRLYLEVRYGQETSLSLPKTSDLFKLMKDLKKLPVNTYANKPLNVPRQHHFQGRHNTRRLQTSNRHTAEQRHLRRQTQCKLQSGDGYCILFALHSDTIEWLRERTVHIDIFLFSAHHSMVFYFRCSVYWWKGSVRF